MKDTDKIPAKPGVIPPQGWIKVRIEGEEGLFWLNPDALRNDGPIRHKKLAPELRKRVRKFMRRLGGLHQASLKETLKNYSKDLNPDHEIAHMEAVADAVDYECKRRQLGPEDGEELQLIYRAAVWNTMCGPHPDDLISSVPALKALPDLVMVSAAYVAAFRKRKPDTPRNLPPQ